MCIKVYGVESSGLKGHSIKSETSRKKELTWVHRPFLREECISEFFLKEETKTCVVCKSALKITIFVSFKHKDFVL